MTSLTWVLESEVFPNTHGPLRAAILNAHQHIVEWSDAWRAGGAPERLSEGAVLFQGSLQNAHHAAHHMEWRPGAFCATEYFRCSAWYASAQQWLMHDSFVHSTVAEFVADPYGTTASLQHHGAVFARPDSPLKPFSGRVLKLDAVSMVSLDHGFYYDDPNLAIVLAPVRVVGTEWRFVIANKQVVTGSSYDPSTRSASSLPLRGEAFELASIIAQALEVPDAMYILDLCECDGVLKLLELNPFSGADLYASDMAAIVSAAQVIVEHARG